VVPFAAVTATQLKVHCASPAVGDDSQQLAYFTPIGGTSARLCRWSTMTTTRDGGSYSSLQLPGLAGPVSYGQRKMILFKVTPDTGVSQNAVCAFVQLGNCAWATVRYASPTATNNILLHDEERFVGLELPTTTTPDCKYRAAPSVLHASAPDPKCLSYRVTRMRHDHPILAAPLL
jgi:hypothetical protein